MTGDLLCPLPHPHPQQTDAELGVCRSHHTRTSHHLADITRLWPVITDDLADCRGWAAGGSIGDRHLRPLTNLDILTITDPRSRHGGDWPPPVAADLHRLALTVTAVRRLRPAATTTQAILTVIRHRDWLLTHTPDTTWRIVTRAASALRRIAGEAPTVIATCQEPHPDPQVDGECGGVLIATPGHPTIAVRCTKCGDVWSRDAVHLAWTQQRHADQRTLDTA